MEEDFSNYSVTVENPVHTIYRGKYCCLTRCHALHLTGGDSVTASAEKPFREFPAVTYCN